jgi:hypothetical protein
LWYLKIGFVVFYYKVFTTIFIFPKIMCLIMKSFSLEFPSLGSPKSHNHDSKPTRIQNLNLQCSMINPYPKCLVSQPYFGQVWGWSPTLGKSWDWSPPGLPKIQKTIWKTKTPLIGVFLVSLKRSWNVDIENALAFSIWTSAAQVMGTRRAGSQIGSLTPDH